MEHRFSSERDLDEGVKRESENREVHSIILPVGQEKDILGKDVQKS